VRKLSHVLPKALGREEVLRTARAQAVLRDWAEIVGSALAERSHPDRFGKGTVWVAVEGSAWAQELRMMKETILARLRERSGEAGLFLDVRFGVRPLPPREDPILIAFEEDASLPPDTDLSIREIAKKRLERWRREGGP
jgi:predicted nucleic acid-binding Zn ribbon protein